MNNIRGINILKTIICNLLLVKGWAKFQFHIIVYGPLEIQNSNGEIIIDKKEESRLIIGKQIVGGHSKKISSVLNLSGVLRINGKVTMGRGIGLSIGPKSELNVSDGTVFSGKSMIISSGNSNIKIGEDCLISWETLIMNNDFHDIFIEAKKSNFSSDITIGNNVWIGTNVTILKGVSIPKMTVIGSNSCVHKSIKNSNSIYSGNPLKEIKKFDYWKK